jgi:ubiquinone/menaquinone biosynthesis C-methylase UbiE
MANNDLWSKKASMKYRGGFPLRPSLEVVSCMHKIISQIISKNKLASQKINLVLLGVTPEISSLPWDKNITLKAFDKNKDMIKYVWKSPKKISSSVKFAMWQNLPLKDESTDFILGDGCTTQFPDKKTYKDFFKEQRRILKAEGFLLLRCFLNTQEAEDLERIKEDALKGRIQYFGSLKWRIAMAILHKGKLFGLRVQKIHETFNRLFPKRSELAQSTSWRKNIINSIDTYKDSNIKYSFPSLDEFEQLIKPRFKIIKIYYPKYELTKRCPILLMKPI